MKLRYKLFTAFLFTSFLIVVVLVGIMQVFVYRNFSDFVNQTELKKLDPLMTTLTEEYEKESSWDIFREKPHYLIRMMNTINPHENENFFRPPPHIPETSRRGGPPPGRPGSPPPKDPLNIGSRLCLFDINRNHIAGFYEPEDEFTYREITLNNDIIGWLGLKIVKDRRHPLETGFLKSQEKAFYLMGVAIFLLSVIISYYLSRHLLSPIQELMKGTKAMASFQFGTKISVRSRDELGKLADDFNLMAKTLKHYEEMRKNWISDISHELRTPITILKGKVEALQDGVRRLTPETLDSLNSDIKRLEKLVEDLHFLSLADSENSLIQKKNTQPLRILKDRLDSYRIRFEKQSIRIQTDITEDIGISLYASREHLERLFSNLIENTLRYTDSPGKLIITHNLDNSWLTIHFEDSHPGVPDKSLELIFNRLYRAEKSRSRALGGSGLGLSICKQIVENHQGFLESYHSKAGGLKLTLKLPLGKV